MTYRVKEAGPLWLLFSFFRCFYGHWSTKTLHSHFYTPISLQIFSWLLSCCTCLQHLTQLIAPSSSLADFLQNQSKSSPRVTRQCVISPPFFFCYTPCSLQLLWFRCLSSNLPGRLILIPSFLNKSICIFNKLTVKCKY